MPHRLAIFFNDNWIAIIAGSLTGTSVFAFLQSIGMAIGVAILTGGASYAGKQLASYMHKKIKNYKWRALVRRIFHGLRQSGIKD